VTGSPTMNEGKPEPRGGAQRRRALMRWSITVAVAAVLIIAIGAVGPALFGQHRNTGPASTSVAARDRSEQLLAQANVARAAGDTQTALALARSAVEADPSNAAASELVTQLSSGGATSSQTTTTPGGSSPSTSTAATPSASPDAGYVQPVADISSLIPTGLAGWSLDPAVADRADVSVSASPVGAGADDGRLIWAVHDRQTVAGAALFITKTSKVLYGKHAATVAVHGVSAYYGTDGGRLATVTYTRGRYVFELIFPTSLGRERGIRAAAAFRDTPVR